MQRAAIALSLIVVFSACARTERLSTVAQPPEPTPISSEAIALPGPSPTPASAEQFSIGDPPTIGSDAVVLIWSEFGGCSDRAIQQCPSWTIRADGSVITQLPLDRELHRINAEGSIDTQLIADWIDVFTSTELVALAERVGPGPCTASYDGIDLRAEIPWAAGLTVDECSLTFDETEPFFAQLLAVGRAAERAAPPDLDLYISLIPTATPEPTPTLPPLETLPPPLPFAELAFHEEVMTWHLRGDCPPLDIGLTGCPLWSVRVDGEAWVAVDLPNYRTRVMGWGNVDPALVEAVHEAALAIDRDALVEEIRRGDPAEEEISVEMSLPMFGLQLTSDRYDLEAEGELLAAVRALADAMIDASPVTDPYDSVEVFGSD